MKRLKSVLWCAIGGVLAAVLTCWTIAFVVPVGSMFMGTMTQINIRRPSLYQDVYLIRGKVASRIESFSVRPILSGPRSQGLELPPKANSSIPAWSIAADIETVEINGRYDLEQAYGWPLLAMSAHWWGNRAGVGGGSSGGGGGRRGGSPPYVFELKRGIELSSRWTQWLPFRTTSQTGVFGRRLVHALPTRILPVGFAANALFYGVFLFLVVSTRRFGRSRLRRWRGECEICAYDLRGGGHDKCPECGTAIGSPD